MKITQYKEPVIPSYLSVDPVTNDVRLLPPLGLGDRILLDNTCKAVKSMAEFFGYFSQDYNDPNHKNRPALPELQKYKHALEEDIALDLIPFITEQKRQRLLQVNEYIKALETIRSDRNNLVLEGNFPMYPFWVHSLFAARTNLFAMLLKPRVQDNSTRFSYPVFSLDRNYSHPGLFYTAMSNQYAQLDIKQRDSETGQDPRELLTEAIVNSQAGSVDFAAIQKALTIQTKKLFDVDIDFKFTVEVIPNFMTNGTFISQSSRNVPLSQMYVDGFMGFDASATVEDYVDALLGLCAQSLWDTIATSPFSIKNDADARDKLIVLTQFFLAELNIYCYANDVSTANFGEVIEGDLLSQRVTQLVKEALASGKCVERELFNFINDHGQNFGLVGPLDEDAFNQIRQDFTADYKTISQSPHFDEFAILVDRPGELHSHQGAVCVDFAKMIALGYTYLDNKYFQDLRNKELPRTIPHKNESVNEISDEMLAEQLITFVRERNIQKAANILLAMTENKQQVFERLERSTIYTIMSSPQWSELCNHMECRLTPKNRQDKGLKKFRSHFKTVDILMTNNIMASLFYVATAEQGLYDPAQKPEFTEEALEEKYGPQSIFSAQQNIHGRLITTVVQNEPLIALLRNWENKLYCNPAMVDAFYQEAVRLHGETSPQIANIIAQPDPSMKLRATLQLLRIPVQEIITPENTENTIIQVSSPAAFTMMTNILHPALMPEEHIRKFNTAWGKLVSHSMELKKSWGSYKVAHIAAESLIADLRRLGDAYFRDKTITSYPEFKAQCIEAVASKREVLSVHRGWEALLAGFINVVNALVYVATFSTKSNFFKMPEPKSLEKINKFNDGLEIGFNDEEDAMAMRG